MLRVIKGDIFEFAIAMCNVDRQAVSKVEFISNELGITQKAFIEGGVYRVRILGTQTKDFPLGFARYDIVATLTDGETATIQFNEWIEILERGEDK